VVLHNGRQIRALLSRWRRPPEDPAVAPALLAGGSNAPVEAAR
jgi:hypothetical protein